MDSCVIPEIGEPPPDFRDSSKSHHPLITGEISLARAKNVVFWGLGGLSVACLAFTLLVARSPIEAVASFMMYWVWGVLYNEGLSKESQLGFVSISICFTSLAGWGWYLSHTSIDTLGIVYLAYSFMTILFQISYSGFLKELGVAEKSNILIRLGARLTEHYLRGQGVEQKFHPGLAGLYGTAVKTVNLLLGLALLYLCPYNAYSSIALLFLGGLAVICLFLLVLPRTYNRRQDLKVMSLMEIVTIYIPLFILLPPIQALTLGMVGVAYFILANRWLWKTSYPRV
jgi:hypothetical protein